MKSLLLKSFVFYTIVMVISVAIQGCCEDEYRITGNGTFEVFDKDFKPIDTIRNEFNLLAQFEIINVGMQVDVGIINSALATSCGESFLNGLLENSVKISLDKPFKYDGQTIGIGSNLIEIDASNFLKDIGTDYGFVEIRATADFLIKAEFEKGDYIFHVEAETTDGLLLQNDLRIFIDL